MKVTRFNVPKTNKESFWVDEYKGKYFFDKLHWHPEIQITLIQNATGDLLSGGYYGRFYPGELYIIGSNTPHVFRSDHLDDSKTEDAVSVIFHPGLFGETFLNLPECILLKQWLEKTQFGMRIKSEDSLEIQNAVGKIILSWGFERLANLINLLQVCVNTNCTLLTSIATKKNFTDSETKVLDKILQFTFTNFTRVISINEVADLACMSPVSFCRYFKSKTQKTYIQFLNEVRIANACKLLMNGEYTIAESALKSGYNNITYFNRKFRTVMDFTPSDYVKIINQKQPLKPSGS